jgi:hypothetical protein
MGANKIKSFKTRTWVLNFDGNEGIVQTEKHINQPDILCFENVPVTHTRPTKQTDIKTDTEKSKTTQNRIAF